MKKGARRVIALLIMIAMLSTSGSFSILADTMDLSASSVSAESQAEGDASVEEELANTTDASSEGEADLLTEDDDTEAAATATDASDEDGGSSDAEEMYSDEPGSEEKEFEEADSDDIEDEADVSDALTIGELAEIDEEIVAVALEMDDPEEGAENAADAAEEAVTAGSDEDAETASGETSAEAVAAEASTEESETSVLRTRMGTSALYGIASFANESAGILAASVGVEEPSYGLLRAGNTGNNGAEDEYNWTFAIYYVKQDDKYYVEKTEDFSLKYQMELHVSEDIYANAIEIRIPATLFTYRDGTVILPDDIAIPVISKDAYDAGEYTYSAYTPMNCYYDYVTEPVLDDSGKPVYDAVTGEPVTQEVPYLVFFNYRDISSGTNIAWQVLYKNLEVMEIVDETTWELQAEVTVLIDRGEIDQSGEPIIYTQTLEPTALTGFVDTYVNLSSVSKTPLYVTGKSYTPGLYTETQLNNYITYWETGSVAQYVKEACETDEDAPGDVDAMEDYIYVVWDVKVKGNGTQPYNLEIQDISYANVTDEITGITSQVAGTVIGYMPVYSTAYSNLISEPTDNGDGDVYMEVANYVEDDSWGTEFYVVVAYPADQVEAGDVLENTIYVQLEAYDDVDPDQEKQASASWSYQNYKWEYPGDIFDMWKEDTGDYDAWLKAYEYAVKNQKDLGAFPYTTTGYAKGYGTTHYTESTGSYEIGDLTGDYYQMELQDGILSAWVASEGQSASEKELTKEDFYFSSITVTRTDSGYDVYEDTTAAAEHPSGLDQTVYIYARYADSTGRTADSDGWVLVAEVAFTEGDTCSYTFTSADLSGDVYDVKVIYNSVNYESTCDIDVTVCIRWDSPVFNELALENGEAIEDDSIYLKDTSWLTAYYVETATGTKTQAYYEEDWVSKTLTSLSGEADMFKTVSSENDAVNQRVTLQYNLTAYDGYRVYGSSMVSMLTNLGIESPGRNYVVFYDLLPYGVQYDASVQPVAGRIKSFSGSTWKSQSKAWDITQVTITEVEITQNWNDTGRTMVAFHIEYTGADAAVYSNNLWAEGWGVSFGAYYDWTQLNVVTLDENPNIAAFMPDAPEEYRSIVCDPDADTTSQEYLDALEEYKKYMTALVGTDTEVAYDDGEIVPADISGDYDDFSGGDLNGDGITDVRNVLYAKVATNEEVAIASSSSITKLVRADSNVSGTYERSASVNAGEGYTYQITVQTTSEIKNIVIYDTVEYAWIDRNEEEKYTFEFNANGYWYGTFNGINTEGLELAGAEPVIYYTDLTGDQVVYPTTNYTPTGEVESYDAGNSVLRQTNGWYTEDEWKAKWEAVWNTLDPTTRGDLQTYIYSKVTAFAIDITKAAGGTSDFVLEDGESVTFLVNMIAPEELNEDSAELSNDHQNLDPTYNNTDYSKIVYTYNNASFYSYSVSSQANGYVIGNTVRVSLGHSEEFELIKEFENEDEVPDSMKDTEFTFRLWLDSDDDGKLDDTESAFSQRIYELYEKDENGDYQLVSGVYATDYNGYLTLKAGQKAVFSDITSEESDELIVIESSSVFWTSSQEKTETDNGYTTTQTVTVTNTYNSVLYVQKTLQAVPSGYDVSNDTFTFQVYVYDEANGIWEVLADTDYYYVSTIRTDGGEPTLTGTAGTTDSNGYFTLHGGEIVIFPMEMTGIIYKVTEVLMNDSAVTPVDSDGDGTYDYIEGDSWISEEWSVSGETEATGSVAQVTNIYRWKTLRLTKEITSQDEADYLASTQEFTFKVQRITYDANGNVATDPQTGEMILETVSGNVWELLDTDGTTVLNTGMLDAGGCFSAACAGRTVVIYGLEQGASYLITETDSGEGYIAAADTVEVTMPVYSTSAAATITNEWQYRSISVTKYVVTATSATSAEVEAANAEKFTFTVTITTTDTVSGQAVTTTVPLANCAYTVTQNGSTVSESYPGEFTTDVNGKFTLKSGQTATFKDAAMLGDSFTVTEESKTMYPQIYPTDTTNQTWTIADENSVTFINGEKDSLLISKDYTAASTDDAAQKYIDALKTDATLREAAAVSLTITTGANGDAWPTADIVVSYVDTWNGTTGTMTWEAYSSLTVMPGITVLISKTQLGSDTYTLTESAQDQHKIIQWDGTDDSWIEISQYDPADDAAISGTIEENPVAAITNLVTGIPFEGSVIEKTMTLGSAEPATGSVLVWQVQVYENGSWEPAEGVQYLTFDEAGVTCDSILTTGSDGRITLTKTDSYYPYVKFLTATVYLNLYDDSSVAEGTYRLVELMDESDEDWGYLAGYNRSADDENAYSLAKTGEDVTILVNSNGDARLACKKTVTAATSADDVFTFYLQQVLSVDDEGSPVETATYGDIAYTLYDTDSGEEIGTGVTNADGSFTLKDGQTAVFILPMGTSWIISENVPVNYTLTERNWTYANQDDADWKEEDKDWEISTLNGDAMLAENIETQEEAVYLSNNWGSQFPNAVQQATGTSSAASTIQSIVFTSDTGLAEQVDGNSFYDLTAYMLTYTSGGKTSDVITTVGDPEYYVLWDTGTKTLYFISRASNGCKLKTRLSPENSASMFSSLTNCTTMNFENCSTLGITSMLNMFYNDLKLESLDLSGWDTSEVTTMASAFNKCSVLKSLDVSGWDTSKVTTMASTFYYCSKLESLDLSGWDTSKVTTLTNTFYFCSSLKNLDLSGWDTSKVTTLYQTFYYCSSLKNLDLSSWDTSAVTSMYSTFRNCRGLESLESIENWKTENVETMAYAFAGCSGLKSLNLSAWNTGKVTTMQGTFYSCTYLESLSIGQWNVEKVEDLSSTFYSCNKLQSLDISNWNTKSATTLKRTFYGCRSLEELDLSGWDTAKVTTMQGTFYNCTKLEELIVAGTNWNTGNVTNLQETFYCCSSLTGIDLSGWNTEKVSTLYQTFYGCSKLESLDLSAWKVTAVATMYRTFCQCTALDSLTLTGWNLQNLTTMYQTFYQCSSLVRLDLGSWTTTEKLTNLEATFSNCTKLEYLNLAEWGTSGLTTLSGTFESCVALKELYLTGWNVGNLTSMYNTFSQCSSLESLDLSGWNTEKLETISQAFYYCKNLKTLDLSGWKTTSLSNMSGTFLDCQSLETLNLTGWDIQNVTTLQSTFANCYSLTELDIADWNTSNVQSLSSTFSECRSLTGLDLSGWKTDNVTTFQSTFSGCRSLESLDVSGWTTSSASYSISYTFQNCNALTSLDLSTWDVAVFGTRTCSNCYALTEIYLPSTLTSVGDYAFDVGSGYSSLLTTVYYTGSAEEWENITINALGNSYFRSAAKVYNYSAGG